MQRTPVLIPELKQIKTLATGSNHVLALNNKGKVYAWGCGQQNQLGRRIVERTRTNGLKPRQIGVSRRPLTSIACGDYHSFAVDAAGSVFSWGLNSYGQTGIRAGAGESSAIVAAPSVVPALSGVGVRSVGGAKEHSLAVTNDGDCLVWGRLDGHQTGLAVDEVPAERMIHDEAGRPRIVAEPTRLPCKYLYLSLSISLCPVHRFLPRLSPFFTSHSSALQREKELHADDTSNVTALTAAMATAGGDTSLLITPAGKAYSWGFSMDYQTAQGTDDEIEVPTLIDNTAVRNRVLNWGGLGAQFGILTGVRGTASAAAASASAAAGPTTIE